ncbi:MAG TPA: glycoside hydrolase [Anaerolineae bacterium]|nr:glycoside hydrolase [Anaerolineae bacterium]HIQ05073.1 glycoside hydrolase [Anaerolineae bacterium]
MITKALSLEENKVRVTFELPPGLWIESAYLVGDFNDWNEVSHPFHQERSGTWRITLELERDREYQFRYLINGQWHNDWHADKYVSTPHSGDNSVMVTR